MELINVLRQRYSNRKFEETQISQKELDMLLEAAELSPVGSNRYEDVHLTVVQDKEVLQKLGAAACLRRMNTSVMKDIAATVANIDEVLDLNRSYDPFYEAPTVIFISHKKQTRQPGIEYCNVSCIATCMHLAATNMGLGSVFMWFALESMRENPKMDHTDLLHLPEDFEPLLGLAVGYPIKPVEERQARVDKITKNYI